MGLFGIVTLTVSQRIREIGIRKILGATTGQITKMLSMDFLILIVIALIPASLIAFYFMRTWLDDFAYRIQIEWWVFALAGVVALAITFLTVSVQSIKAALTNPVKSLRSE
jgi:putative ABC transport system permease protein